jgi:AraC-like DNA-binding protein
MWVGKKLYTLNEGDVLVIGSSELHCDRCYTNIKLSYLVLQFDISQCFDSTTLISLPLFSEKKAPLSALNYMFHDQQHVKTTVHQMIQTIYDEVKSKQIGYELAVSALLRSLMVTLLRYDNRRILLENESRTHRFEPSLLYIEANFKNKLSAAEAARLVNMNYYHFSKTFKKELGISFSDYVNQRRMKETEKLLLTSDQSIEHLALEMGFTNISSFYAIFRRAFQMTPHQFRYDAKSKEQF